MAADTEPGWQPEGRYEFSIGEPGQAFRQVRPSLPFFARQPDSVSDAGTVGGLAIRAASVRGLHHRYDGKPRQDAYGAAVSKDGEWFVAVVADGVGNGPRSQYAAGLVSRYGPELVCDQLASTAPADLDWWGVFAQLAAIIVKYGQRNLETHPVEPGARGTVASVREVAAEMASTATFAVCHTAPSVQDGWKVTVASQGDSPVWTLNAGGSWRRLSGEKPLGADGLATSKVLALPLLPAERGTHPVTTETLVPDGALFLMSDGVGDPLGDADDDVALTLGRAWARPPHQYQFTAQIGFGRKGFDDDRTVVGIWADGGAFVNGGERGERGERAERGQPAGTGHRAEHGQPAATGRPAGAGQLAGTEHRAERGQPAAASQPAGADQPAEAGRPAEAGQPAHPEEGVSHD